MKREVRRETQSEGQLTYESEEKMYSKDSVICRLRFNKTQLFFSQIICLNNDMSIDLIRKLEEVHDQFRVRQKKQVSASIFVQPDLSAHDAISLRSQSFLISQPPKKADMFIFPMPRMPETRSEIP